MSNLTNRDYQNALWSQDACNLSGIVFSFADVMKRICADSTGTDMRNNHAICRLYAEQIMFLTSGKNYEDAWTECENKRRELDTFLSEKSSGFSREESQL